MRVCDYSKSLVFALDGALDLAMAALRVVRRGW